MVQKTTKLARPQLGVKTDKPRVDPFGGRRKAAPKVRYVDESERRKSAAIVRNVERLMASRVAHEGGVLRILGDKETAAATEFEKSGPRLSKLQTQLRAGQNAKRRYVFFSLARIFLSFVSFLFSPSIDPLLSLSYFSRTVPRPMPTKR